METPIKLSAEIIEKAKTLNVTRIILRFEGGSDEGYLTVDTIRGNEYADEPEFQQEIEDWAWDNYSYSGAGDGHSYGDDIAYDLEKGVITVSDWSYVRQDGETVTMGLDEVE